MKNLKSISKGLLFATLFIFVSGVVSYLTATGKAVIGPDPENVDIQQAAIAVNTAWWMAACIVGSVTAFVMSRRKK